MSFGKHEVKQLDTSDTWLTPIEIVNSIGPFDLDPCGYDNHLTATTIYYPPQDGLCREWSGRVWLNPPYSNVEDWLHKLRYHTMFYNGKGVALVFARVDTKWAQFFIKSADSVFIPQGRIKFTNPHKATNGSSGSPSMFLSFGEYTDWLKLPMKGIKLK